MEFLLIWLAFAVICAIAAPSRNRSATAWFFIGAVFGIFALIALLVMGKAAKEDESEAQPRERVFTPSPSYVEKNKETVHPAFSGGAHSGSISVRGEVGKGTTFTVEVPASS